VADDPTNFVNDAEARLADCFAELPVVYTEQDEIPCRRAAYEKKLRQLRDDAESGLLQGDVIEAIGNRHPFLLAYQGVDDRSLQEAYGRMISGFAAQRYQPASLPPNSSSITASRRRACAMTIRSNRSPWCLGSRAASTASCAGVRREDWR